jgi:uncharacterized protein (TIGR03435 family)
VPEAATKEQFRQMIATLLAERFGLKSHREQREMAIFELGLVKGGPKFTQSTAEPPEEPRPGAERPPFTMGKNGFPEPPPGMAASMSMGGKIGWRVVRQTMPEFADGLSGFVGKPVIDATGLGGKYDLLLYWFDTSAPNAQADATGPTIFSALQEQLGLKLDSSKGRIEVLVVDQISKTPTEN